jgi:hypothetical protein
MRLGFSADYVGGPWAGFLSVMHAASQDRTSVFETPTPDGIRPSFKALMKEDRGKVVGADVDDDDDEEEEDDDMDEENENLYEADFEIGHFFKEFLVPKAVLYFTGEIMQNMKLGLMP